MTDQPSRPSPDELDAPVDGPVDDAAQREISAWLAAEPVPVMPAEVAARLDAVLLAEAQQRAASVPYAVAGDPRPRPLLDGSDGPGGLGASLKGRRTVRFVGGLLAALAVAAIGYVVTASAGLNEPVSSNPVSIDPSSLVNQATGGDDEVSPHRFSRAWRCVREVTDGTVTGIRSVVVDGGPALLAYTRDDGATSATLVTGCAEGDPKAGATVLLPTR